MYGPAYGVAIAKGARSLLTGFYYLLTMLITNMGVIHQVYGQERQALRR